MLFRILFSHHWGEGCNLLSIFHMFVSVLQLFGRVSQSQRQLHMPSNLQCGCSVPVTLALMLTIFLIGELLIFLMIPNQQPVLYPR